MNEILELPNGIKVGTGLQMPVNTLRAFPSYETAGPMISLDDIVAAAKSKQFLGRTKFGKKFIKNQRTHGSCNGFAGATALEKARVRRLKEWVQLSGAYLYSLINGGSDNGSQLKDGMITLGSRGCATQATVGWDLIYPSKYDKAKADAEAADNKAFECYEVRKEVELFSALVSGFDVVVAVHADNGFMKVNSAGVAGGGNGNGNHAVSADGVDYIEGEGLVADGVNSWDVDYGVDGRMGLTWKRHFIHTTPYHVFYAIRSTLDGSKDAHPPVAIV